MMNKKFTLLFALIVVAILLAACEGGDQPLFVAPSATPAPTETATNTPTDTPVPTATNTPRQTSTQAATKQPKSGQPVATQVPTQVAETKWVQIPVAKFSESVEVDGTTWELPLGTYFAVSTENGRYEAVPSAPVGEQPNGKDLGWCSEEQYDCPPHGMLVRIEVPQESLSCLTAKMDVSWRIQFQNACREPVMIKFDIRYNDQTRNAAEQMNDYLSLAGGLTTQIRDVESELGLFVSTRESGQSFVEHGINTYLFGYSCWDCLANSAGPNTVPYSLNDFETFGTPTAPLGSSLIPGIVFPLPRPENGDVDYELSLDLMVSSDNAVVWLGQWLADQNFATATPTPTPRG